MGNIISSFFSGFGKVISNLFGSPLDFLAGKSCSSACRSTWDFICYIENLCLANLLKMAMVLVLIYIVLLLFYLLYKLGICECICEGLCRIVWACFASWFHAWEYCCIFLCVKLGKLKRIHRHHRRNIEDEFDTSGEEYHVRRPMIVRRSISDRWRDYRGARLRKSLRPRSHGLQVGIISRDSIHGTRGNRVMNENHIKAVHGIRVVRTSKFAHKGRNHRRGIGFITGIGSQSREEKYILSSSIFFFP